MKTWTDRKRAVMSAKMKAWWASMPEDEKQARLALRLAQFRRRHPERAVAHDLAMEDRQPCHVCGDEAYPVFAKLPSNAILGWRCREHWPPRPNKTPSSFDGGVESAGELID